MAKRPESTLKRDLFKRRHETIRRKANHLARSCSAYVYVVVLFHGQYYTYTSYKHRTWPPSEEQIVGIFDSRPKYLAKISAGPELSRTA